MSVTEDLRVTAGLFLDNKTISLQHAAICMCSLALKYCSCYSCVQLDLLTLHFFMRCAVLEATGDFPCRIKDLASTNKVNLCGALCWLLTPLLETLPQASGLRRPGSDGLGHRE